MKLKNLLFSLLLIIIVKCEITRSEIVSCEYRNDEYDLIGRIYSCIVQNKDIFAHENINITGASGNHENSMTNDDVKGIEMQNSNLERFLPSGIENVFKNLEVLNLLDSKLTEIHQSDLKPFVKLRYLALHNNKIKLIEADLFKYNIELEVIMLDKNQISFIHPNVFDHLNHLQRLDLSGNNFKESFDNADTKDKLEESIKKIRERKCINIDFLVDSEPSSLETIIDSLLNNSEEMKEIHKTENEKLNAELSNLKVDNINLTANFKKEIQGKNTELRNQKVVNKNLKDEIVGLNTKLNDQKVDCENLEKNLKNVIGTLDTELSTQKVENENLVKNREQMDRKLHHEENLNFYLIIGLTIVSTICLISLAVICFFFLKNKSQKGIYLVNNNYDYRMRFSTILQNEENCAELEEEVALEKLVN